MHFHFLSRLNITAANRQSLMTTEINNGRGSSRYPLIVLLLLGAFSGLSMAAGDEIVGDAAAGASKAALCAACHGGDGKGTQDTFPNLAGQGAGYIAKQLAEFKSGTRANAVMLGMAAALSEQDMADLGAYYESLPAIKGVAEDREDLALGESIYRGGITEAKIPACMACHGPSGTGNPAAKWPALAGQYATYLESTLKEFRSQARANDPNEMMRSVAKRLSDAEISALANYLQGLN